MNVVKKKESKNRMSGTTKNKLYASAMMSIGVLSCYVANDATFLVLITAISLPMFFSKEDWIL